MRRRIRAVAALVATGLLVGACGSSSPRPRATGLNSPYALSECMRDHGVSGFPDPRSGPGGGGVGYPGGLMVQGPGDMVVMGIPFHGPAVASAMKACAAGLPPSGPAAVIPEAQRLAMIANAHCMRTHGVPNFPDPTFPSGGIGVDLGPGVDPRSPAFKAAEKACNTQLNRAVANGAGVVSGP